MPQLPTLTNQTEKGIREWFESLRLQLSAAGQRVMLSCQGSQRYCDQVFQVFQTQLEDFTVLSNRNLISEAVPFSKSEVLLGLEYRYVIVDCFDGINADVIAIAGGLVKSGGMLILLSEEPSRWSLKNDLFAIWQNDSISSEAVFIRYFFDQVARQPQTCLQVVEGQELPEIPRFGSTQLTAITEGKTQEQAVIINRVADWLGKPDSKFTLITASRGRGKSVCLGLIAKKLIGCEELSVCVTAYSKASAEKLLAQLDNPVFASPDTLIENPFSADVLLIDEAAMLPSSILVQLCSRYKQLIMATTTGGYEGTGQGFILRFAARLPATQLLHLKMNDPVRWSANDNLENWLNHCLLMNPVSNGLLSDDNTPCAYRLLKRPESQADLDLMVKVYRLMVAAHYRTRPSDLRALMENPDLILVLAECGRDLVGVALLNAEGGFEESLCEQIFLGERRPRGHLLAQMLTAQAGSRTFARLKGVRIQRIAVHESKRRQGIGRQLVNLSRQHASDSNCDYIGATFAFDHESTSFWKACKFDLAHVSYGQGKSTGRHSIAVINMIKKDRSGLIEELQQRIRSSMPIWCCQYLHVLDCDSVIALIRYLGYTPGLSRFELDEVRAFGVGYRGFDLCFVSLQKFVMQAIVRLPDSFDIHPWLVEKMVQNRDWAQISADANISGRKARQKKLRKLIVDILQADIGLILKPDTIDANEKW